jgi:hypothetical protein
MEDVGKMSLNLMGLSKTEGVPRKNHAAKLLAYGFNLFTSF